MPESYRYLRVRLQIEQQRFLNFGLESGILYADGVICAALQVNRSLLLAVLAEQGTPTIVSGFALGADAFHAPNESYRLESLRLGELTARELYRSLADLPR